MFGFVKQFEVHSAGEVYGRSLVLSIAIAVVTTAVTAIVPDDTLPQLIGDARLAAAVFTFIVTLVLALPLVLGFGFMALELTGTNRKLADLANRDPLTGLLNRRAFTAAFNTALATARVRNMPGLLMVIDADHFKRVNDTYGHDGGDEALVHLANLLECNAPEGALVSRLGGEEFIIAVFGPNARLGSAETLRLAIAATPLHLGGDTLNLTVSIGCRSFLPKFELAEIMRTADQAAYRAKANGRNRVEVFEKDRDDRPAAAKPKPVDDASRDVAPSMAPSLEDLSTLQPTKRSKNDLATQASS